MVNRLVCLNVTHSLGGFLEAISSTPTTLFGEPLHFGTGWLSEVPSSICSRPKHRNLVATTAPYACNDMFNWPPLLDLLSWPNTPRILRQTSSEAIFDHRPGPVPLLSVSVRHCARQPLMISGIDRKCQG